MKERASLGFWLPQLLTPDSSTVKILKWQLREACWAGHSRRVQE